MKLKKVDRLQELIELVEELRKENADLKRQLLERDLRIKDLEDRLNKNSQNSSKPPSTDYFRKPKSERIKSGKKAGGQQGHEGSTLKQVSNPDVIQKYEISQCDLCHHDLSKTSAMYEKRQVIDIPPVKAITTEHQFPSKKCPNCRMVNTVKIPIELSQQIQYGPKITSLASYLHYDQLIPFKRIQSLLSDVFSVSISEGTLVNMHETMFAVFAKYESTTCAALLKSPSAHFDETGMLVNGKLHWMHTASTNSLTLYFPHLNRGAKAIDAFNILPQFKGVAIHDHWKAYFQYDVKHGLCNAHHIRELRAISENYQLPWAQKMRDHLILTNDHVIKAKSSEKASLTPELIAELDQKYDSILQDAKVELPNVVSLGKRGKPKQHPAKNLHDRLTNFKTETLRFMHNFEVPFTNNQAEQDIRMTKVKQKISGGFRTMDGAIRFCRIRGQISTFKKQQKNVFHAFETVIKGQFQNLSPGA